MASSFTLYARDNSSNCQKVIWLFGELDLPLKIVPAGLKNVLNKENPEFRKMNPTGLVPFLVEHREGESSFSIDESNTILRFVCSSLSSPLAGSTVRESALVSRWQDLCVGTLEPAMRPIYFHFIRGVRLEEKALRAAEEAAIEAFRVVDSQLAGKEWLANDRFSLAEITCGAQIHRFFTLPFVRPSLPNLEALYARLKTRKLFLSTVVNIPFV